MYCLKREYQVEQHVHDMIYVEGVGEIEVPPDMAIVTVTVESQGLTPLEAEVINDKKVSNYTDTLKDFGLKSENIIEAKSTVIKEEVENQNSVYKGTSYLNVYLYDLNQLRGFLYHAENAGLKPNRVNFTLEDPESYYNKALDKAVVNGIEKAKRIGETINGIVDLNPNVIRETSSFAKIADTIVTQDELADLNFGYIRVVATVNEEFEMKK